MYILNGAGSGSVRGLYTQWDWIRERERVYILNGAGSGIVRGCIYSMGLDQ